MTKIKQKFIDPVIKKKTKDISNIQYTKEGYPLPSIIEISESGTCNRKCSFVLEVTQTIPIAKIYLRQTSR